MRRPWQIWTALAAALALATGAVGWLSIKAIESQRAEAEARQQAELEENARLALWRIDSSLAALVAQENARPYFAYQPFYSADVAYGRMFKGKSADTGNMPSPLLTIATPEVRLYFQFAAGGQLTSPRVPTGAAMARAVPDYLSDEDFQVAQSLLDKLGQTIDAPTLMAELPPTAATALGLMPAGDAPGWTAIEPPEFVPPAVKSLTGNAQSSAQQAQQSDSQSQQAASEPNQSAIAMAQQSRGVNEYRARQQNINQSAAIGNNAYYLPTDVRTGIMTPVWLAGQLLLVRRVTINDVDYAQGCWIDWPMLRSQLLASVMDLLPHAELLPVADTPAERFHLLAALPVRLLPGAPPESTKTGLSPVHLSLLITWLSLVLAAVAVAVLLRGVLGLSERRAAFVSAVTHELRTPLTTFRMYAEMLAEDMLPDQETRHCYLNTLRTEADRLMHLVDNVLAYARLERGGPGARIGPVEVEQIISGASRRLAERAAQAHLTLSIDAPSDAAAVVAIADPAAVEQILFNLVDNACKYAQSASDRRLELSARSVDGQVQLRLRDHGPGVIDQERNRLFQPFHKSARDAAHSAPGVGLGLALSRRLARDMGGDLRLEKLPSAGACFVLVLRKAAS